MAAAVPGNSFEDVTLAEAPAAENQEGGGVPAPKLVRVQRKALAVGVREGVELGMGVNVLPCEDEAMEDGVQVSVGVGGGLRLAVGVGDALRVQVISALGLVVGVGVALGEGVGVPLCVDETVGGSDEVSDGVGVPATKRIRLL